MTEFMHKEAAPEGVEYEADPYEATLLTAVSRSSETGQRHIMTKHHSVTETGAIESKTYGNAYLFDVEAIRFEKLEAIAGILERATWNQCVIRGDLIPGRPNKGVKRRCREKDGEAPTFYEVPRSWVMIDFDTVPLPESLNPKDPKACGEHLASLLPEPFRRARFCLQFSSSHLVKPENFRVIKAHLFFLLSRPLTSAELKEWLSDHTMTAKDSQNARRVVDPKPFETVQPHYIAKPILEGIEDPVGDQRVYVRTEGEDVVEAPDVIEAKAETREESVEARWRGFIQAAADAFNHNAPDSEHHRFLSAISSVLYRTGFAVEHIAPVIVRIARATNANDPERRANSACRDTISRLGDNGVRVPGRFVLRDEYGFDIDEAMRVHLKHDPADLAVAELNERYAMITGGSNAGKIADLSDPRDPAFLTKDRLGNVFVNKRVLIADGESPKRVPKSNLWITSENRREITDIVFEPPASSFTAAAGTHNLWQGFAIEPEPGDSHEGMFDHLYNNVCDGDLDRFEFLFAWLADLVQRPGDKPGVAVALRGPYGAGKSVLYEYLRAIFGRHAMKVSRPEHLTGRFNAHMASLCLLGVEEGFWAGDKQAEAVLKDLITGREVTVEQKFADPYTLHNHVHILTTSNEDWVVPAGPGDRRWAVFDVKADRADDKEFWGPIHAALDNKGPANFLNFLLCWEYDHEVLFRPPMTTAKAQQVVRSLGSVHRWWLDVIRGERQIFRAMQAVRGDVPDTVFEVESRKGDFFADYRNWCKDNQRRLEDTSYFWRSLNQLTAHQIVPSRPSGPNGKRVRVVRLPSREDCRTEFAKAVKCDWSDLASFMEEGD